MFPLRALYFSYYVAVGTSVPFFSPYLKQLGLSGRQIGLMLAIAPVLHLGAPAVWGWAADRTRRPDWLLRLACAGALIFCAPLIFLRSLPALFVFYGLFQAFAIAIGGLADSLTVERARKAGGHYTRTRLFGSLSFALVALGLGRLLEARGPLVADPLVPATMAGGFLLALGAAFLIEGRGEAAPPRPSAIWALLRDRRFLLLLVIAPLHWASLAPYHGFFGILLGDRGFRADVVGAAWLTSVAAEIGVLFLYRRLQGAASLWLLFALTFGVSAVRWWLTALIESPTLMIATQALHALSFGVFWATALAWLSTCVPPELRATGQLLFNAATYGLGNILGMVATGQIYDRAGGAPTAFVAAGALELVPLVLIVCFGRRVSWLPPSSPPR